MNFTESMWTALDALNANKLRSILTMLGVIIGVAAVIALLGLGNGFRASIEDDITSIGSNLLIVLTDFENSDYPTLSNEDFEALQDVSRAPDLIEVAASVSNGFEVIGNGRDYNSSVTGVTGNYFKINNLVDDLEGGAFFTDFDIDARSRVAVIGYDVVQELFDGEYAVGQTIKIGGGSYEVIGSMKEIDSEVGANPNGDIFVPITTAQTRLRAQRTRSGKLAIDAIVAQASSADNADAGIRQITEIIRENHGVAYADEDDFTIISQGDFLETVGNILGTVTLFLGAVAGISLLVGGIGIMNIMLVSVTERTREIGIRKSMGALRRDILMQFMIESLFLSLLGGLIGMGLGWLISTVVGNATDIEALIDASAVTLAVGFSVAVGLIFGIYPAWRAARLRPIDALRYE